MSLALVSLGAFVLGSVFGAILQAKTQWITKSGHIDVPIEKEFGLWIDKDGTAQTDGEDSGGGGVGGSAYSAKQADHPCASPGTRIDGGDA